MDTVALPRRRGATRAPEHALAVTSQFYFCSLPLRLDPYRDCGFRCTYCFALARGGNSSFGQAIADARSLDRRLTEVEAGKIDSAVDEFLARGQPIHIGGMSDPFPPQEARLRATYEILAVLANHKYPAIISTKSTLFADDDYLSVLQRGTFMVQASLSSLDAKLLETIDLGAPSPRERLEALRRASRATIPTSVRIQPILPGHEADAEEVVAAAAEAGARHVAAEHLKLPLEKHWWGRARLEAALGERALRVFGDRGRRSGREWILPVEDRLPTMLRLREAAIREQVSFGVADNDLLWLSAGTCCCSGADAFAGFSSHYRCNYTEAIRRAVNTGEITIGSIRAEWRPRRSVSRFVNSNSRLPARRGRGADVWAYLEAGWNGSRGPNSPAMFYGVRPTDDCDDDGYRVYELSSETRRLARGV